MLNSGIGVGWNADELRIVVGDGASALAAGGAVSRIVNLSWPFDRVRILGSHGWACLFGGEGILCFHWLSRRLRLGFSGCTWRIAGSGRADRSGDEDGVEEGGWDFHGGVMIFVSLARQSSNSTR